MDLAIGQLAVVHISRGREGGEQEKGRGRAGAVTKGTEGQDGNLRGRGRGRGGSSQQNTPLF